MEIKRNASPIRMEGWRAGWINGWVDGWKDLVSAHKPAGRRACGAGGLRNRVSQPASITLTWNQARHTQCRLLGADSDEPRGCID